MAEERLIPLSGSFVDSAASMWDQAGDLAKCGETSPAEIMRFLAERDYVLLIDDFHYVERSAQQKIAQQLKEAVGRGLRVVVISVSHRVDDPIRANPDLRGRVQAIDLDYWNLPELVRIADRGFPTLNLRLKSDDVEWLASESLRSPQLMQALCLETCKRFGVAQTLDEIQDVDFYETTLEAIARATCSPGEGKSGLDILSHGPRERGRPRTQYEFADSSKGDVYTVVIKAIASDPPRLDFPFQELKRRADTIVIGEGPTSQSIQQAAFQMDKLVREKMPKDRVFEWDQERQYADVPDPHFLFYLRWGPREA